MYYLLSHYDSASQLAQETYDTDLMGLDTIDALDRALDSHTLETMRDCFDVSPDDGVDHLPIDWQTTTLPAKTPGVIVLYHMRQGWVNIYAVLDCYDECPTCLEPIDYCQGHGTLDAGVAL